MVTLVTCSILAASDLGLWPSPLRRTLHSNSFCAFAALGRDDDMNDTTKPDSNAPKTSAASPAGGRVNRFFQTRWRATGGWQAAGRQHRQTGQPQSQAADHCRHRHCGSPWRPCRRSITSTSPNLVRRPTRTGQPHRGQWQDQDAPPPPPAEAPPPSPVAPDAVSPEEADKISSPPPPPPAPPKPEPAPAPAPHAAPAPPPPADCTATTAGPGSQTGPAPAKPEKPAENRPTSLRHRPSPSPSRQKARATP